MKFVLGIFFSASWYHPHLPRLSHNSFDLAKIVFLFCSMSAPVLVSPVPKVRLCNSRPPFRSFRAGRKAAVQPAPSFSFYWKLRAWLSTSSFCATDGVSIFDVFHRVMFIRYFLDRERGYYDSTIPSFVRAHCLPSTRSYIRRLFRG